MRTKIDKSTEIRNLKKPDFDNYFALRLESLQQCPHMYATDANDWQNAPREVIEKHLALSESNEFPILGAWKDEKLVGLIGLRPEKRPTVQHKATIWGLYVTQANRHQGIGTALLDTVIDAAHKMEPLRQLRAVVNTTNQEAVRLFQRAGFIEFGLEQRAKYINGNYHDQVYYWYPLHDGD